MDMPCQCECGNCGFEPYDPEIFDECGGVRLDLIKPPTAPPDSAESEDAKNQAREFFARHEHYDFYSAVAYSGYKHATDKQAEIMAQFAIEFATKQIERQTPAIIERFVAEVEIQMAYGAKFDDAPAGFLQAVRDAMQTVKARRSGGEGK